jgi:hypothetical protein
MTPNPLPPPDTDSIWRNALIGGVDESVLQPYTLLSGAEIYAEVSRTGLNTQPPDDLAALTLVHSVQQWPNDVPLVDVKAATLRTITEGSLALMRNVHRPDDLAQMLREGQDPAPEKYSFLDYLMLDCFRTDLPMATRLAAPEFSERTFAQCFWLKPPGESEAQAVVRIWTLEPDGWNQKDYIRWGTPTQKQVGYAVLPADAIIVRPNGLGELFRAQKGYRRMENILISMEQLQTGPNSKLLIVGYLGNSEQAHTELNRKDRDAAILPDLKNIYRVTDTAQIDRLETEFNRQLSLYLARLHFPVLELKSHVTDEQLQGKLYPIKSYIDGVREDVDAVVEAAGGKMAWQEINIESIDTLKAKYELLKMKKADDVINQVEFAKRAEKLAV